MTGTDEAVLAYWNEQRVQLRQSENQRAVLTNYMQTIVAAIGGLVVRQDLHRLWTGLHIGVASQGLVLIILTAAAG